MFTDRKYERFQLQFKTLQKSNHTLVCSKDNQNSVTPTGAWCLIPDGNKEVAPGFPMALHHVAADSGIALYLIDSFFQRGSTLLDIGCGIGQYGHFFTARNPGKIQWTGYDGALNVEDFTRGYVKYMDFSQRQIIDGSPYDWVISLEIGEHMPVQYEDSLFNNIHSNNKCGAIVSWAVPGQGGHSHVNERSNDYIIEKFTKLGYKFDRDASNIARNRAMYKWFRNTFMIFHKRNSFCAGYSTS
jgi:2-polyprenyl-3-methyl-5-hydroxy-6-metoxy-1,4-benzoquinol methylase